MYNSFKKVIALIKNWANKIDSEYLTTMKKLHSKEIIYWLILKTIKGYGGKPGCSRIQYLFKRAKLIKHKFTQQAINEAAKKIPAKEIFRLSKKIYARFFNHQKGSRVIAVDGTRLSLSKNIETFKDQKFQKTISKSYCKGLLTVLYDLKTHAPIASDLTTYMDERASFLRLKQHLRSGDILIFDRGYYSKPILENLIALGVKVVFRISKANKSLVKNQSPPQMSRLVAYKIEDKDYMLLTTLSSDYSDLEIKNFYHDRWGIEEFYKFFKIDLGGNFYNFKLVNSLEQALETQFLTSLLIALISQIGKQRHKLSNNRISPKYTLDYMEEMVFELIYGSKGHLKFLKEIMEHVLENCLIQSNKSRSFPRTAIINRGKWYGKNQVTS